MTRAGLPVPHSILAHLLVDTGASCTNLDARIITKLGIAPTGSVAVNTTSTAGTPVQCLMYDVELRLDGGRQQISSLPVIEGDFSMQGIDGLLGRDFLQFSRMIYCGPENHVYISF